MRKILGVPLLLMMAFLAARTAPAGEQTVTLAVEDMTCVLCPFTVEKALENVDGVAEAEVSYRDQTAVVTFDDEITDVAALREATSNAGYPSSLANSTDQ